MLLIWLNLIGQCMKFFNSYTFHKWLKCLELFQRCKISLLKCKQWMFAMHDYQVLLMNMRPNCDSLGQFIILLKISVYNCKQFRFNWWEILNFFFNYFYSKISSKLLVQVTGICMSFLVRLKKIHVVHLSADMWFSIFFHRCFARPEWFKMKYSVFFLEKKKNSNFGHDELSHFVNQNGNTFSKKSRKLNYFSSI